MSAVDASDDGAADAAAHAADAGVEMLLIAVTDRVDAVHDAKRGRVYVSTRHGQVVQYDLRARSVVDTLELGGVLGGLDLSPDQDRVLVADRSVDSMRQESQLHVIDLESETDTPIVIATERNEAGTLTGVFVDDDTALITSTYSGSGHAPMRIAHLNDGTVEPLRDVTDTTMVATSPDRSTVGFAQGNASNGPFGRYDVATGIFQDAETDGFTYEVGVSRDAAQLAVLKQGQARFYDDALDVVGTIGISGNQGKPMYTGIVYSPTADRVCLNGTTTPDRVSSVDAFDSRTLEHVALIDSAHRIDWHGNHPLESGRLRIARDGHLLLATVDDGVVVYFDPP